MKQIRSLVAVTVLSLVSSSLMATMAVSPLRLDLNQASTVNSLTVFNRSTDQSVLQVQASVKAWSQANGDDVYTDQKSVLLLPPIFGVPAGQSQVVRVALLQPNDTNAEQTYRIFINQFNPQQVTVKNAEGVGTALNVLLNISIPVFVASNLPEKITLSWAAGQISKQTLPIQVTNTGNTHVHFAKVTLTNSAGTVLAATDTPLYVLAGATMTEPLQILKPLPKGPPLTITAQTDDKQYPTITGQISL